MSRHIYFLIFSIASGLVISLAAGNACIRVTDPLYCDQDIDCGAGFICDMTGQLEGSNGLSNTCVPDPALFPDASSGGECQPACAAPTPVCDDGRCVECTSDEHCEGAQCDTNTNTCVPCIDNEFCDSGICNDNDDGDNSTNACIDPMQIYYVEPIGSGIAPCGRREVAMEMPCTSISAALANTEHREWIHVSTGTDYQETAAIAINAAGQTPLRIVGQTGSQGEIGVTVRAPSADRMILISGSEPQEVTLEGIALKGGGSGADSLLRCSAMNGVLRLYNVELAQGEENAKGLVVRDGCQLRMERTAVNENGGGGVEIVGSSFTLYNNIIRGNMAGDGLRIDNPMKPANLEFNTISGNTGTSGITCIGDPAITASHNIIDHTGDTDVVDCNAVMAGANSLIDTDVILSPDGHLEASSGDAIDGGAASHLAVTEDFDGDLRPQGDTNYDIGADELYR